MGIAAREGNPFSIERLFATFRDNEGVVSDLADVGHEARLGAQEGSAEGGGDEEDGFGFGDESEEDSGERTKDTASLFRFEGGRTLWHVAAESPKSAFFNLQGRYEAFKALISSPPCLALSINDRMANQMTPIEWAIHKGEVHNVLFLCDSTFGAHLPARPCQLAVEHSNDKVATTMLRFFLETLPEVCSEEWGPEDRGRSLLCAAVKRHHSAAVRLLLHHGADVSGFGRSQLLDGDALPDGARKVNDAIDDAGRDLPLAE